MEDERIWDLEKALWTGGREVYREHVGAECLMALPSAPFVFGGAEAIQAVADTPRWDTVEFRETKVSRPQEGLIVIAYRAEAHQADRSYHALCTTTLRRLSHEQWEVVQHQQTPLGIIVADPAA